MTAAPPGAGRRRGRPPKSDDPATKDRLLDAAADACIADGFEAVTLAGIADRAGVTATAIYNHFASREELLYAAGRRAIDDLAQSLSPWLEGTDAVRAIAHAFLRPEMAATRRLVLELHVAGTHHPDLAVHLAEWHHEFAKLIADVVPAGGAPMPTVKALFLVLLGLCHIDDLGAIKATPKAVRDRVDRVVDALYPRASA